MSLSRRTFTKQFKQAAVRRLELGASVAEVARACEVNPNVLYRWRRELRKYAAKAFPGEGNRRAEESRIAELERKVGRQAMEIDMLAACRGAAEAAGIDYPQLVYPRIQKEVSLASLIPIRVMCRQGGVSRAGFYRWRHAPPAVDADMDLRDEIQHIALGPPCYGWRRVTAELHRRGWTVNHKRVRRIMREDNLLCLRRKKFVVTTDSNHHRPVYPNLAANMVVTDINQLWVADITYIRLEGEFVYLAVVLDAHSRRVIGWALDRTLQGHLAIAALQMALCRRSPMAGFVHHSDRGIQYASKGYTDLLKEHRIAISMSRKGNPYDNATCESFLKTLKCEEVYRQEYRDLGEVLDSIGGFIESVYNERRLHSALGYRPPSEFEQMLALPAARVNSHTFLT